MKLNMRRVLVAMLLGVCVYFVAALYSGIGKMRASLATYHFETFFYACGLAFTNYCLRFLKWEFYLSRLGIRGVKKWDSFLTFFSGFVLTVTPGKVGEVFKSYVLSETHGVPMPKTAPIVVAERATDVIGIVVLIVMGSVGFGAGWEWAGIGAGLVLALLVVIANRRLSLGMIDIVGRLPGRASALKPKLETAYENLAMMLEAKNLVVPSVLSIAAWTCECLSLWVILHGFGEKTSFPLCTFFYATSTLAGAVIPVPGGLGITESSLLGQMRKFGEIGEGNAASAMILVRFATLWFAVVNGFIALSILKKRNPGLLAPGGIDRRPAEHPASSQS